MAASADGHGRTRGEFCYCVIRSRGHGSPTPTARVMRERMSAIFEGKEGQQG
jgi:hypothetical protein